MSDQQQQRSGESIGKKTRQAKQQLLGLVAHLNKSDETGNSRVHGLSCESVIDVLEKFALWAGNLGALQPPTTKLSLDYRVSDTPEVRDEILRQLEDVIDATDDLLNIVLGTRENLDLRSILGLEEEMADLSFAGQEPSDESLMILDVISESISSLFRIGILVRRATTRDRFKRALQVSDLTFPPQFDVAYVREKHPKIRPSWLSARLGGTIAKRRQFIRYCRDHRSRLGAEQILDDDATSRMEKTSSRATTFALRTDLKKLEVEEEDDGLSFTSASTMTDSASLLRLPSLADLSPEGKPFECPICFTLQALEREKAWKKHAFRDLKAYVCTMGGSECGDLLFGDRDSWFDHELKNHRATYTCPLCDGARRTSKSNLRLHLATHGGFSDQQLRILEDASQDPAIHLRARDCPFCDEWAEKLGTKCIPSIPDIQDAVVSIARFKRHVATHQEQLAIFALPRAIAEDETVDKESTLNSNFGSDSRNALTDGVFMREAQEETKKEIESARVDTENAARERMEAESKEQAYGKEDHTELKDGGDIYNQQLREPENTKSTPPPVSPLMKPLLPRLERSQSPPPDIPPAQVRPTSGDAVLAAILDNRHDPEIARLAGREGLPYGDKPLDDESRQDRPADNSDRALNTSKPISRLYGCYFEQTRWACGYWRWGACRQQCTKDRMGETCGLKLVYETKTEPDVCKLCHDTEKKQRRYDKMYRDVQRWQREGNRTATIERTCGEMQDVLGQIYRMREEHDHRLQSLGQCESESVKAFQSQLTML
ncbi:ankyrin repeat [Fusarium mundagurra]|uniref:Ankyrin repeat n=1 Tax=Fusarium mundagurra TaxID=1567541 RepID=A0A8H5XNY2_9HYPO|nr:ankyrin repeat [Fusarium mundagurra]